MSNLFKMSKPILMRQLAQCDPSSLNFNQPKQYYDVTMHYLKRPYLMQFKDTVTLKKAKFGCELSRFSDNDYFELENQLKWLAPNHDLLTKTLYVNDKFATLFDENNVPMKEIDPIDEFDWFIQLEIQGMKHGKDGVYTPILVLRRATRLAPIL